jgi:hypothetical protein
MSVYKILKDAAPDFHDLGNLGDPDKADARACAARSTLHVISEREELSL